MRFMIIVKATPASEAGVMPEEKVLAAMADYHERLVKAGVLLDACGLHPSDKGWRVQYDEHGQRHIVDGPFPDTTQLIGGYSLVQVRSREEAMEWSRRFPAPAAGERCEIEVRQIFDLEDFDAGDTTERFKSLEAQSIYTNAPGA